VLWRLLAAGVFLVGLGSLLRSGVVHRIPREFHGLVFLGVLPLSVGNLDNAQANPLIAGLMMLSVAALEWDAWTLCAIAIGIAITFKIYPIALALLLCILRPKQLPWRIGVALVLLALLPFAFQDAHYVTGQYHAWLATRLADDRFQYPMKDAPLDLWYLLVRLGGLPISEHVYMALQVSAGAALALFVFFRRASPVRDTLASLYLLVSVWMLLLGPATENQTYVILGPAACLLAVESLMIPNSLVHRTLSFTAFALLLAAVARNSLAPHLKSPLFMAIQPISTVPLFFAALTSPRPTPRSPP
jgi:hypothetical protein